MITDTGIAQGTQLAPTRLWQPKRVLITRSALEWQHGRDIAERAAALGIGVQALPADRLSLAFPDDERQAYAAARQTLVIVVAPSSKRRLQPIAPSADWRIDLDRGTSGALQLLLSGRAAEGAADHARLCQFARNPRTARLWDRHLAVGPPRP